MTNPSIIAESIKERVSMLDAIQMYAPNPKPQHNRIPCPVHGGTNYNLGFNNSVFHCFTCGTSGDVISFIMHIFGLSFPAALDKLNTDFNLALPIGRRATLREQRDAQNRHNAIMAERAKQEQSKREYDALYDALWDEYARLDRNKMDYAPQSMNCKVNPLYIESLQKIDYQNYLIDTFLAKGAKV